MAHSENGFFHGGSRDQEFRMLVKAHKGVSGARMGSSSHYFKLPKKGVGQFHAAARQAGFKHKEHYTIGGVQFDEEIEEPSTDWEEVVSRGPLKSVWY